MTSAYGAFANGGVWERPQLVRRVEDTEGNVLFRAEETAVEAVSPATAFLMSSMLADVIDSGTAWKARQLGFRLPASGKTGTTNEYRDAWFVGYTPSLTAGVWVGYDTPRQILPGSAYAGDVAVPLWAEFMKAATRGDKPEPLVAPRNVVGVTVCRLSGKRPAGGCDAVPVVDDDGHQSERSMIGTEYFVRGTEPDETCHLHVGRSIFGRLAGLFGAAAGRSGRAARRRSGGRRRADRGRTGVAGPAGRGGRRRAGAGAEEARLLVADFRPSRQRAREEGSAGEPAASLVSTDAVARGRRTCAAANAARPRRAARGRCRRRCCSPDHPG